jgi:GST-like protein
MSTLSDFPIVSRRLAQYPERSQLYSVHTPNGVKAPILLQDAGLPYAPDLVGILQDEKSYQGISIAQSVRQDSRNHRPLPAAWRSTGSFQFGAVLVYPADKTDKFVLTDSARRRELIQWVFFQTTPSGPNFGEVGFLHKFAGKKIEDKRTRER